ncbi:MAG: nucleotidyl transferase AbiEii/AbiGii toxin family protein, partial [Bdellovibrionaceae bacterium]|nr:nucleotidyl transferase AbiEii/AbiGii toxin family protein [Pseudobdellovibrionaceae bacterium]
MKTLSEQAIKDRLRKLAKEQGKSVNELLKKLYLERFLARLARSNFKNQLIFKGDYLLRYYIKIERETKDLDFLFTQLNAEIPVIKKIFQSICSLNRKDSFSITVLKVELLDHPHMTQNGFRVTLQIKHTEGTLKDNLQIDLSVGDVVNAKSVAMSLLKYKSEPFFEDKISLKAYPPELIFAEKLIAIISKGKI